MPSHGSDGRDGQTGDDGIERRQVLRGTAAASAGGLLAGCAGLMGSDDSPETTTTGGETTDQPSMTTPAPTTTGLPRSDATMRVPFPDGNILEREFNRFHPNYDSGWSWKVNARWGNRNINTQEFKTEDEESFEFDRENDQVVVTLRDGLFWHPAQKDEHLDPVTAHDIKYQRELQDKADRANPEASPPENPTITDTQVGDDDKTVVFNLSPSGWLEADVYAQLNRLPIELYRNGWSTEFDEKFSDATTDSERADHYEEIIEANANVKKDTAVSGGFYFDQAGQTRARMKRISGHWAREVSDFDKQNLTAKEGYQAMKADEIDVKHQVPARVDDPPSHIKTLLGQKAATLEAVITNYSPKGGLDPWLQVDDAEHAELTGNDGKLASAGTAHKKNAKVNQAIVHATDFADVILNRFGLRTLRYGKIPDLPGPTQPSFVKDAFPDLVSGLPDMAEQDQELAEQRLSEAGLTKENGTWKKPSGDPLVLEFHSFDFSRAVHATIVEDLNKIGVQAKHMKRGGSLWGETSSGEGWGLMTDWLDMMAPLGLSVRNMMGIPWPNRSVPRYFEVPPVGEWDAEPSEQFDVREFAEGLQNTPWEDAREKVRKGLWVYFYHLPKIGIAPYIPTTELNSKHFEWPEHPDWDGKNFVAVDQDNAHEVYTQRYGIYNWLEEGKVPVMGSSD